MYGGLAGKLEAFLIAVGDIVASEPGQTARGCESGVVRCSAHRAALGFEPLPLQKSAAEGKRKEECKT